ncbi:MAG TPA: hypothetical protein VFS44_09710 [Gemmatimonadaceae bacterium]|nr:hypothetical protein [Gemmatimonadaceae bacterium]
MDRIRFIEHRKRRILYYDFRDLLDPEQAILLLDRAEEIVRGEAPGSVLVLMSVRNLRFNSRSVARLRALVEHNRPYVRASAVVGMEGLHKLIYFGVVKLARRNIPAFDDEGAAKEWLVTQ